MSSQIRKIKRKLHRATGFTLAETLVTVLILLMVSSIVVAGIPAAINAYKKVVVVSNAEVLLSTTVSVLRNELGTSRNIKTEKDTEDKQRIITYYNGNKKVHTISKIYIYTAEDKSNETTKTDIPAGAIAYQQNAYNSMGKSGPVTRLVSSAASTEKLYVTYGTVEYNSSKGIVTFNKLEVKQEDNAAASYASLDKLSIQVMSY